METKTFRQEGIENPANYLRLEGRVHEDYSYSDLFVGIHRLGYGALVEQAAKSLGLNLQNTGREKNGFEYIGNLNRTDALKTNLTLGGKTLNLRQGIDFLIDLHDGADGRKVIYHGNGDKVESKLLEGVCDEIVGIRNPWRGEWFDAGFEDINGVLHINYEHELKNGILVPQRKEKLEKYLKKSGVKVRLQDFNKQGLAVKEDMQGNVVFWQPFSGSVARLYANSGRFYLNCSRNPDDVDASLGVRHARENFEPVEVKTIALENADVRGDVVRGNAIGSRGDFVESLEVKESYTPQQISLALNGLGIEGLVEEMILEKLRKAEGEK